MATNKVKTVRVKATHEGTSAVSKDFYVIKGEAHEKAAGISLETKGRGAGRDHGGE